MTKVWLLIILYGGQVQTPIEFRDQESCYQALKEIMSKNPMVGSGYREAYCVEK